MIKRVLRTILWQLIPVQVLLGILYTPPAAHAEYPAGLVSFRFEKGSLGKGEPVMADVTLRDTLSKPIDIDLGGDGYGNIAISIVNPEGQRIDRGPIDGRNRLVFSGRVHLEPGETYRETLVLNEWFEFGEIGHYTVTFGLNSESAPPVALPLEVKPRDEAELKELCSELVSRVMDTRLALDSLAASKALSFVQDPIAIPSWVQLLKRPGYVDSAIAGLARIGSADAARALISNLGLPDEHTRSSIRSTLEAMADQTTDEDLRQNIRGALMVQR